MFTRDPEHGRVMDIVMLGPRGVGKTSLLASLYDRFHDVVGNSGLELMLTDRTTRSLVQDYREELRRFAAGGPARDPGIGGSEFLRHFLIGVGTKTVRRPQVTLRFTDFPGEALQDPDNPARAGLEAILPNTSVIFVAIDSPALLERDGFYNTEINKPDLITEFVKDAVGTSGDKLVVLVPLKCERYAKTPEGLARLSTAVHKEYDTLVRSLAPTRDRQTAVVLTTVQTVGSMVFSRFEPAGSSQREVFRPVRPGATYSPEDTDQPLRWMLRFAVNAFMARDKSIGEWFSDWWNSADATFTSGVRSFGEGCKKTTGFEVLCDHPYLELP